MTSETSKYGLEKRRTFSPRQRLAVFEAHKGVCCLCGLKIIVGDKWIVEHIIALELGGGNDDSNIGPSHDFCATEKTKGDHARGAKLKRVHQKHIGIKKEPRTIVPGSRASKWKKKANGTVVLRDSE